MSAYIYKIQVSNVAECNLPKVNLEPMQPVIPPIYVHDLQGDLNSLPVACLCSVTLQLIFADHLLIQLSLQISGCSVSGKS